MMAESAPTVANESSLRKQGPVLDWFAELQKNSGAAARLRRCRSTTDTLSEPLAIYLARRLGVLSDRTTLDDRGIRATLDLARVLAHVRTHVSGKRTMQLAGWKQFPGDRRESDAGEIRPRLSEVRFRRLLATQDGEPLVAAFIRLVRQLSGSVNVVQLARDFREWGDPERGEKVRQLWAFDYYAAGTSAPRDEHAAINDQDELQ